MTARSTAQTDAVTIRDETVAGANTHTRVGAAIKELADNCVFTEDAGAVGDIADLGTKAAGAGGKFANAAHVHTMPRLDQVLAPTAAVSFNANELTSLAAPTTATSAAQRQTVDFLSAIFFWGDGSDGDLTISSGTTTLTRDTFYNNVTISGTASLDPRGFRVYVAGILDLTAAPANAITRNGGNGGTGGATGTAGTAGAIATNTGVNGTSLGSNTPGTAGGAGGTAAGAQAAAVVAQTFGRGGDSGASGAGGAGASGAGGAARAGQPVGQRLVNRCAIPNHAFASATGMTNAGVNAGCGGPGGGGGGGDGTAGPGGGGGGASGSMIEIYARTVSRGASTAVGCIAAKGGDGASSAAPGAGNRGGGAGGSGGGGGDIHMVVGFLTGSSAGNALDASGGAGGAGGNGLGTGIGGTGGTGGNSGTVALYVVSTGTISVAGPNVAGTAGAAGSGVTGGTGGVAGAARVGL